MIRGFFEVYIKKFTQDSRNTTAKFGVRVNTGADSGAANREFGKRFASRFHTADTVRDLVRISSELLTQPNRRCILQVCPGSLNHVIKLFSFISQCIVKHTECWQEFSFNGY